MAEDKVTSELLGRVLKRLSGDVNVLIERVERMELTIRHQGDRLTAIINEIGAEQDRQDRRLDELEAVR